MVVPSSTGGPSNSPERGLSGRPTSTTRPATVPEIPNPGRARTLVASAGRATDAATARPIGCSEFCSTAAAKARTSSGSHPSTAVVVTTVMRPSVRVPVLSKATMVRSRACSMARADRMSIPSCAPRPVPTCRAVGVARPRAQGQAMISTATVAETASPVAWPASSQPTRVAAAIASTVGTKIAATRSTRRCTGAREAWASATNRASFAGVASAPTRVADTVSTPVVLSVPPLTWSPTVTSSGTASPVSIDMSMAPEPATTVPSAARRSPGRATKWSPTASWSPGISRPSARRTVVGTRSSSARSALPARCRAPASNRRPTSTRATITAPVSK